MPIEHEDSNFVSHEPCDKCGSRDGNSRWSDGHLYCFVCETYTPPEGETVDTETLPPPTNTPLLDGTARAIPARGLSEEDCKKFGYLIGQKADGSQVQIAQYRDAKGRVVAQKLRGRDKSFQTVGDFKGVSLFGAHLWSSGKKVCLVEGELDAISLSKCWNHQYACVSLPNGAQSAVRAVKQNFDYLNGFEEVVIALDMDEAGQKAAQAIAEVLPPGKARIARLPAKDANAALMEGKVSELMAAVYQAAPFRPDGIKSALDYRDVISVDETASSISWPFSALDQMLMGLRRRELITLAAGSGCGKTTFIKELAYHLMMSGEKVGLICLEEAPKRTLLGLTGIHLDKNLLVDRSQATDEEVLRAFDDLFADDSKCVLYDSFGTTSPEIINQRIEYMARSLDCTFIILDHVTMLTASMVDERRELDKCVTAFRSLVEANNIGMIMVSHLTRPGGRGHEDGAAVSLSQLRSSHSLAQLADAAIGLQKDPEDPDSDIRFVRVLKNRFSGAIGDAGTLLYNRETGRLQEFELSLLAADQEDEEAQNDNQDNQPHSTSRGHEQATVGDEGCPAEEGQGQLQPQEGDTQTWLN